MDEARQHDLVVVGGGPAGVNAALECVNNQLDTLLLEAGSALGGQLAGIPFSIRNVATGWYEDGPTLQVGLQRSGESLESRVLLNHAVTSAGLADGWVEAAGRRFHGKSVLIASGSRPQRLSDEATDGAFGGDVTYQLERRPDLFAGQPVIVVGGGDSATLDALELAGTASTVMLVHRSDSLSARHDILARVRADSRIVDLPGWQVESLRGGQHLEEVTMFHPATGEERTVAAGGLVVKISRDPNTDPFKGQVDLDRRGFVVTDSELRSSRAGVFAAGDVVSGAYWRIAFAMGHGMLAARSILHYLESL